MPRLRPFHIAFSVDDLEAARAFYSGILGCPEGRSSAEWVDFDLFGHQIVAHLTANGAAARPVKGRTWVDGEAVPVPHFGVILEPLAWADLAKRLRAANVVFGIEPHTRFEGRTGEQSTMFFFDPAGNALEFKTFADVDQLFARSAP